MEIPASKAAEPFCYLTTVGRKSGRLHTVEMWFAAGNGTLYALSGGGDRSDWVRNLRAEPRVTVRVGDMTVEAMARVLDAGTEEDATARRSLAAKYQGWNEGLELSEWARTALPVAITPL